MISSLSTKYARALFEVVSTEGNPDSILQELRTFEELLKENRELRNTLENPVLPFPSKRGVVEAVAPRIPISKPVQNFILVVISNARIHQYRDFVDAFSRVLDESRGIERGIVFSANALDNSQQERIAQGMKSLTGQEVRLDFERDESLIGGIKIRMGSTIFDGSIRARLNELERRLAGQ